MKPSKILNFLENKKLINFKIILCFMEEKYIN